ncbi:MAG: hypothetical protein OXG55_01500 [bacterium]|nr:hypothetical protein [bacterium]
MTSDESVRGGAAGPEDPEVETGVDLWAAEGEGGDAFVPPWWVGYDTLLAVVAFVVLFRFWGLGPAIGAITIVSVLSGIVRVRHGVGVGKLLPLVTVCIIARGIVGIVTDNDDIYFGIGIGYKFAIAAALVLSASPMLKRNPAVDLAARSLRLSAALERNPATELVARSLNLPSAIRSHEAFRSALDRIIVAFGLLLGLAAGFDIWFLGVTDPDQYVLFRYLINWPLYVAFTALSLNFLSRRLGRIPGFPGIMNLLEEQAEARTAARKRR